MSFISLVSSQCECLIFVSRYSDSMRYMKVVMPDACKGVNGTKMQSVTDTAYQVCMYGICQSTSVCKGNVLLMWRLNEIKASTLLVLLSLFGFINTTPPSDSAMLCSLCIVGSFLHILNSADFWKS